MAPSTAPFQTPHSSEEAAPKAETGCCCPPKTSRLGDRLGLGLSALCAVHCMVTPALLILSPALGQVWTNPWVHTGLALVVAPLALFMTIRGYRKHRRAWVPGLASVGVLLVVGALAAPAVASGDTTAAHCSACAASGATHPQDPNLSGGTTTPTTGTDTSSVLPTFSLHSSLTLLGGLLLITAHAGNLWRMPFCKTHPDALPATEPENSGKSPGLVSAIA